MRGWALALALLGATAASASPLPARRSCAATRASRGGG